MITEDGDEDIDGATNNPMAADEEMIDGSEEEGAGHDGGEEAVHGGREDQAEHDREYADMPEPSSLLH